MRIAAPEFGVPTLILIRLVVATLALAPLLTASRRAAIRRHWKVFAVLAAVNSFIPFTLLSFATKNLSAGLPSIINATVPFFSTMIAWFWFRDRPRAVQWVGLVLGFSGVVVLVLPKVLSGVSGSGAGVAAGLAGAMLYGFALNFTKRTLSDVDPMAIAVGGTMVATLYAIPGGVLMPPRVNPPAEAWIAVLVLGAVCTGYAYVLFYRLFASVGPTKAVTVTFLIPVFGVLWGAVFLDEPITWNIVVGGVLVLAGMALITGLWKLMTRARRPASG